MEVITIGYRLLLAFLFGASLGLEREVNEKTAIFQNKPTALLGFRTFSLVSLLGAILGFISTSFMPLALLIGSAFLILLIAFYILDVRVTKDAGITTEIALLYSFIIGLLLALDIIPIQIIFAIAISVLVLLSQKQLIKKTLLNVQRHELNAFISLLIIAFAILPFLPNTSYSLQDIPGLENLLQGSEFIRKIIHIDLINPFKIWLYVALITGIDFIGYMLERLTGGKKGWIFASIAGGFVSSTATTQSLAQESKSSQDVSYLVSSAILANVVSFLQIAFLILTLNSRFLFHLLPILICLVCGGMLCFLYFIHVGSGKKDKQKKYNKAKGATKIIDLKSALVFAGMFIIISLLSKIALELFGQGGFLLTTGIGALIGLDAVMINTSQLVGGAIPLSLALIAFILANAINLLAKVTYSYILGSKEFTVKFGLSMILVITASIAGFFISL